MVLMGICVVMGLVVLGPTVFRRRTDHGGGASSISHFHHQLQVLEHSGGMPIFPPAFRLQSVPGQGPRTDSNYADLVTMAVLPVVGAKLLPRPALAFLGEALTSEQIGDAQPRSGFATSPRMNNHAARVLARRRRRETLAVLALVFTFSLLASCLLGVIAAWVVTAISGVSLGAYVMLLVHMQAMVAESERKLHYLRPENVNTGIVDDYDMEPGMPYEDSRYDHPAGRAVAR